MSNEIEDLNAMYEDVTHPLNFFEGWSEEEFKFWLRLDEYGLVMSHPREDDILAVLEMVQPFEELGYLQNICLQELVTLEKLNLIKSKN